MPFIFPEDDDVRLLVTEPEQHALPVARDANMATSRRQKLAMSGMAVLFLVTLNLQVAFYSDSTGGKIVLVLRNNLQMTKKYIIQMNKSLCGLF